MLRKSGAGNLSLIHSTLRQAGMFPAAARGTGAVGCRGLSVPLRTLPAMTDHCSPRTEHRSHLRMVGPEATPAPTDEDPARRAYWARAQALRDELERLRVG